jgi:hypothetical protein
MIRVCLGATPRWPRMVFFLFAAVALGTIPCARASEWQYWPKVFVRAPISEHWQLGVEGWATFVDDVSRFNDTQLDVWLTYFGLADWLSVGVGYKRTFEKADDGWETEDRPMLNAAIRTKVYGFGVTDRSRLEYRIPEEEDEFWRYRNRLTITSPVTFTPLEIQPYTAGEVFYSFDGEGFSQKRLYGGAFLPLHEKVRLELFYLWKHDKEEDGWHSTNVIGSWVYFQF